MRTAANEIHALLRSLTTATKKPRTAKHFQHQWFVRAMYEAFTKAPHRERPLPHKTAAAVRRHKTGEVVWRSHRPFESNTPPFTFSFRDTPPLSTVRTLLPNQTFTATSFCKSASMNVLRHRRQHVFVFLGTFLRSSSADSSVMPIGTLTVIASVELRLIVSKIRQPPRASPVRNQVRAIAKPNPTRSCLALAHEFFKIRSASSREVTITSQ